MNFKISIMLRFFCCLILLASSINSLDNDDNSREDDSRSQPPKTARVSSIKDQLKRFSKELKQSKEREDLLKVEVGKIDETLNELKSTVDEIKLQVKESDAAHDRRLSQLSDEIKSFEKGNEKTKIDVNAINQALKKNETLENSAIPFIDFHKCKTSLNIEEDEPTFKWVVSDLRNKKNQPKFEIESDIFPLKGYSLKARAQLSFSNGNLWLKLSYKNNNKSSADVVEPRLLPAVKYVFKNQSALGLFNDVRIREVGSYFNSTFNYDTYYYGEILIGSPYDVSDTVVIDIYVETPEQAEQSCSENGTIAWVIHDVSKKRELAKNENVPFESSPYFYSGPKGYRMVSAIFFYANGRLRHQGVTSTNTVVLRGPYDDALSKSFRMNSTLTFLHPYDPSKNLRMLEGGYVTIEELESVIVDNSLYYHVATKIVPL